MSRDTNILQRVILLFLLIFIALPAPRESYSLLIKLYAIGILLIVIAFLINILEKKTIILTKYHILLPFFFIPVIFAIIGFFKGNESYYVVRELSLFILPLLTFIVVINTSENIKIDDLLKLILWIAVIAGAFLLVYEIFGLVFHFENRYQFRFEYVSRNIGFIALAYILYLFKTDRLVNIFWPGSLILISSLAFTMGRLQWIAIAVFTGMFLFITVWKLKYFIKVSILALFLITPILTLGYLLKFQENVRDDSILWRQEEAKTVIKNIKEGEINPFIGNGLGYSLIPFKPLKLYHGESFEEIQKVHNLFLYLITKTGTIGMLAFLISIILLYKHFYREGKNKYRIEKYFLLSSYFIFVIFVDGSVTGNFTMNVNAGMELGLFLALMEKLSAQMNQS